MLVVILGMKLSLIGFRYPNHTMENLPKLIEIQKKPYILTQDLEKNFVIYSAICPHQQNIVSDLKKDVWHCPSHDWTFDPANGNCLNIPNESLDKINTDIIQGLPVQILKLYAIEKLQ